MTKNTMTLMRSSAMKAFVMILFKTTTTPATPVEVGGEEGGEGRGGEGMGGEGKGGDGRGGEGRGRQAGGSMKPLKNKDIHEITLHYLCCQKEASGFLHVSLSRWDSTHYLIREVT